MKLPLLSLIPTTLTWIANMAVSLYYFRFLVDFPNVHAEPKIALYFQTDEVSANQQTKFRK
jgi:hypothetical protein